ncbi:DUF4031 domain-containing protein [Georgenia faecalis]|uniref:DUF4031 domain-containing protein n=1 Tax=Georgenia faecalis TaxID=2483799 RepID=UPI000FD7A08C|nr:DUF4031 domain-containing protein [Georgenia faecalis]
MAILIDEPRWPAHGTLWAHVVSDASEAELHAFARAVGLPERSFDLDHYDVPAARYAELVAAGALPVDRRSLITRLRASGLRVAAADRADRRRDRLQDEWDATLPGGPDIGAELLRRWQEPHRAYHSVAHLRAVLDQLRTLAAAGTPVSRAVVLAAWFHDAVHDGASPADEDASARLAADLLPAAGVPSPEVAEVARLVRLTATHTPEPGDDAAAALCDADLAVLGAPEGVYRRYAAAIRAEYRHLPDDVFRAGRATVLRRLLDRPVLFATAPGRARWERQARANVAAELAELTGR